MLSKRYKSTEVDRRTWLHVPSGTHWYTNSDPHQVENTPPPLGPIFALPWIRPWVDMAQAP